MLPRRTVIAVGSAALAAAAAGRATFGATGVVEVHMRSDPEGSHVGFDPVGLLIEPGQTVRWICDANVHTTVAYHPSNNRHSLRIPRSAKSWASDFLMPGESFEVVMVSEGVYDYFCAPHEQAGMVGRIIVGRPSGPGRLPFDYFKGEPDARNWLEVPAEARAVFPSIAEIMQRKRVPANMTSAVMCRGRTRLALQRRLLHGELRTWAEGRVL